MLFVGVIESMKAGRVNIWDCLSGKGRLLHAR